MVSLAPPSFRRGSGVNPPERHGEGRRRSRGTDWGESSPLRGFIAKRSATSLLARPAQAGGHDYDRAKPV